jgi:hypothetical protein
MNQSQEISKVFFINTKIQYVKRLFRLSFYGNQKIKLLTSKKKETVCEILVAELEKASKVSWKPKTNFALFKKDLWTEDILNGIEILDSDEFVIHQRRN